MNFAFYFLAICIAVALTFSLETNGAESLSVVPLHQINTAVMPYYKAVSDRDWSAIAKYSFHTANQPPPRYFFPADVLEYRGFRWRLERAIKTIPKMASPPEGLNDAYLVIGTFQQPESSVNEAHAFQKPAKITVHLWLRVKDEWLVIPGTPGNELALVSLPLHPVSGIIYDTADDIVAFVRKIEESEARSKTLRGKIIVHLKEAAQKSGAERAALRAAADQDEAALLAEDKYRDELHETELLKQLQRAKKLK